MSPVTASACFLQPGRFHCLEMRLGPSISFALAEVALAAAIKCLSSKRTQAEAGACAVGQGRHGYRTSHKQIGSPQLMLSRH